jgi:hypothetical protein
MSGHTSWRDVKEWRETRGGWERVSAERKNLPSVITYVRDVDYGFTVKYLDGIPISFTKDRG